MSQSSLLLLASLEVDHHGDGPLSRCHWSTSGVRSTFSPAARSKTSSERHSELAGADGPTGASGPAPGAVGGGGSGGDGDGAGTEGLGGSE